MRLIVKCEHGKVWDHWIDPKRSAVLCTPPDITDPDAILAALAEAGVLKVEKRRDWCFGGPGFADESYVDVIRYFSLWKEAK